MDEPSSSTAAATAREESVVPSSFIRDDAWSCVVVFTFCSFVSMTLIFGVFGSMNLQLGPYSSFLIAPSPLFVEYIKVEQVEDAKPGPNLYGFNAYPKRDVINTWSRSYNTSLIYGQIKEWVYILNEGSHINISYSVKSSTSSSLILIVAEGREGFVQWLENPSYPNTTLSWNVIHGSCTIQLNIATSTSYYVALGNMNSEEVEGTSTELWDVKISYGPRWLTYIVGLGGVAFFMLLVFRCLNNFQFSREDRSRSQFGDTRSERAPLLSQKDDDLASWGSSYDSVSGDDEYLEEGLAVGSLEGTPLKDGEYNNNIRRLCAICFDAPRECFFLPCGHCVACFDCGTRTAEVVGTCPICRRNIKKVRKIFTV